MLHISHDNLCTTQNADRLARIFLKLLMERVDPLRTHWLDDADQDQPTAPDPLDVELGIDVESLPLERAAPRADLCAMAVMLAREFDKMPGFLAQLRHRSPMLCITTVHQDEVELFAQVLEKTVFAGRVGETNPTRSARYSGYSIFGSATLTLNRIQPWYIASRYQASPVVLISSDPAAEAGELLRAFSLSLTPAKMDITCLNLVIETICDQPSNIDLDPAIVAKITHPDCAFAIVPERSPSECAAVLISEVEKRSITAQTGPRLEQLADYGAAKVWGLELVNEIQAYVEEELAWSDFPNRSVLLCGAPGTGKTSFAAVLARSAGVPFIASSVAEWNTFKNLGGTLTAMRESTNQFAVAVIVSVAAALAQVVAAQAASPVEGTWRTENGTEIAVTPCAQGFCGALNYIVVPKGQSALCQQDKAALAAQMKDDHNLDTSLRSRSKLGMTVLALSVTKDPSGF